MTNKILVFDIRPDGHQSFGTLPKLEVDEFNKLQAFYHMVVDTSFGYDLAKSGELYWSLLGFELKAGPAILQPQVRNLDGNPYTGDNANVAIALHWPGADLLDPAWQPRYKGEAQIGWTEGRGNVGFGYSGESHIGPDGGPFSVWAMSGGGKVGSDAVHKLGWWDDHITPNPIFQISTKGGGTPTGELYLVTMDENNTVLGYIPWNLGLPPVNDGAGKLGLMKDGQILAYIPWNR